MEFSIKDIMELLYKRIAFIFFMTLAGLCAFFVTSKYIVKPTYTASVQMYVYSNDLTSIANLNDLNYAQKVVTTYINFLQTKKFYKEVIEECNLNYTQEQLKAMTEIKAINNTEIFQISVTTSNPIDSFYLVEAMQKIAPELIKNIKYTVAISVVDPAVLPTAPSSPNILINTMVGGLAGLFLSILASLLWEIIDVNVKDQEDLRKKYQLPILGAIPYFYKDKKRGYIKNSLMYIQKKYFYKSNKEESIDESKKFIIAESYKALRANWAVALRKEGCKKIMISSAVSKDGKSTTTINMGVVMAQTGVRVLLMDCDLRKGRLHRFFNFRNRPGISDVLSGRTEVQKAIHKTSYENLDFISMGSMTPNPTEILASTSMKEFIAKLEEEYDYIIIDTPPVNVVSDALSLVNMVDGMVIVVREKVTSHPNILKSVEKFKFVEANILGFVINGVFIDPTKNKNYDDYYNYGSK